MAPKPKSQKRAADVEDYDSDGGFVEDAPKSKRAKPSKAPPSQDLHKDDDGNEFWEVRWYARTSASTSCSLPRSFLANAVSQCPVSRTCK